MKFRHLLAMGAVVGAGTALALPGTAVAAGETASPSASNRLTHVVTTPVRGGTPAGVPGQGRPVTGDSGTKSNGISYHGGPVMNAGVNAYVIWYGNWTGDTATTILPDLLTGLNGSAYYNINTTYYDGSLRLVPNRVTFAGQTTDAYSQGKTNLSDTQIASIVSSAITTSKLARVSRRASSWRPS